MKKLALALLLAYSCNARLLLIAGLCRVFLVPFSGGALALSALFWCAAFGLFLVRYTDVLLKPRV